MDDERLRNVIIGAGYSGSIVLNQNERAELSILDRDVELFPAEFPGLHFLQFSVAECGNQRRLQWRLEPHVFERDETTGFPPPGVLDDRKNRAGVAGSEVPVLGKRNLKDAGENLRLVDVLGVRLQPVPGIR